MPDLGCCKLSENTRNTSTPHRGEPFAVRGPPVCRCAPGSSCHGTDVPGCAPIGSSAEGEACIAGFGNSCVPGTTCVGIQGGAGKSCEPYCDPAASASGANACTTLCPGSFWTFDGFGVCKPDA